MGVVPIVNENDTVSVSVSIVQYGADQSGIHQAGFRKSNSETTILFPL